MAVVLSWPFTSRRHTHTHYITYQQESTERYKGNDYDTKGALRSFGEVKQTQNIFIFPQLNINKLFSESGQKNKVNKGYLNDLFQISSTKLHSASLLWRSPLSNCDFMYRGWQRDNRKKQLGPLKAQKNMFYVFEKHFKLFEGQQCLPGLDLWNNTNINPVNNEIIYQLIKKLCNNLKRKQAQLYKKKRSSPCVKGPLQFTPSSHCLQQTHLFFSGII